MKIYQDYLTLQKLVRNNFRTFNKMQLWALRWEMKKLLTEIDNELERRGVEGEQK